MTQWYKSYKAHLHNLSA